uniref:Uncharacterized protein n=1 Tax=Sphaerodactylus townsendi TaxID=933632 RepID=A0ACB8F0E6_9SAUR
MLSSIFAPPPSPRFLPLRRYRPPKESEEPDSSKPLCFSKSPANPRIWTVARSMGSDYQQPGWRVALISLTMIVFLLWCALRPETEIDRFLEEVLEGKFREPESQAPPPEQEKP